MEPQTPANPTVPTLGHPAPSNDLPNVPQTWPGAFGVYKFSKKAVLANLSGLILVWALSLAVGIVFAAINQDWTQIITNLLSVYFGIVSVSLFLAGTRGEKQPVGEAFQKGIDPMLFLKMLGLGIIMGVAFIVSILLLIVPFFFILPKLILAPYYLIDKNMGIDEALSAAWKNSTGNAGKVWGIVGAMILMSLLMITIIGIPFAIYLLLMYSAAFAVLYRFIDTQPKTVAQTNPAVPTDPTPSAPTTPPVA